MFPFLGADPIFSTGAVIGRFASTGKDPLAATKFVIPEPEAARGDLSSRGPDIEATVFVVTVAGAAAKKSVSTDLVLKESAFVTTVVE